MKMASKRLELLKEVVSRVKRVSILFNASSSYFPKIYLPLMEANAKRMQVELHQFSVRGPEELPDAFAAMAKKRVEAAVIGEAPLLQSNAGAIAALALSHRLPTTGLTSFADAGGLLGYGANRPQVFGRAASFVDRIFKGAKPGDLPIEGATKFDLIINLKTAKALGIKVSQAVLQRADRVIE